MFTKNEIQVRREQSNKSENLVWVVYATKKDQQYCRNANTALKYAFLLKTKTGRRIADDAFNLMLSAVRQNKQAEAQQ